MAAIDSSVALHRAYHNPERSEFPESVVIPQARMERLARSSRGLLSILQILRGDELHGEENRAGILREENPLPLLSPAHRDALFMGAVELAAYIEELTEDAQIGGLLDDLRLASGTARVVL